MAQQRDSLIGLPTRIFSNMASAKLCMEEDLLQPDFSSFPPQLASLTAEVWALISSPHIQRLIRLQGKVESDLALDNRGIEQIDKMMFDRRISAKLLDRRLLGDKRIARLSTQAMKLRREGLRRGLLASELCPRVKAGVLGIMSGNGGCSHLASGQFAEAKSLYDEMVKLYTLEIEAFTEAWCTARASASVYQTEAELHRRIVAFLCSERSAIRPDKAKLGFLIHLANRLEQFGEADSRVAALFQKNVVLGREMLQHYKKIQKHLAIVVRTQAELKGGKRG